MRLISNDFFEKYVLSCWWVFLFMLGCYMCYEHGLRQRQEAFEKLYSQYQELHKERDQALSLQGAFLSQINSQSDPDWIELTLMKVLGLVAEGQTKVLFTDQLELLDREKSFSLYGH